MGIYRWFENGWRVVGVALLLGAALLFCAPNARAADVWIDELILDVAKAPYRLTDVMIVLQQDNRFYVPAIELAELLDFAVEVEQDRGFIKGWAVSEDNSFALDVPRGEVRVRDKIRSLSPEDVMTAAEYPGAADDIFISLALAAEIWPITLDVDFSALRLNIASDQPLPFEARKAREQKRDLAEARRKFAPSRRLDLPLVPNPYRLFSLPAIDVDTQARWDENTARTTGQKTVTGVMDLAGLSVNFGANATYDGDKFVKPDNIRITGNRKAYGDETLFLGIRDMQVGDTRVTPRNLIANSISGRGAVFTTRSVENQQDFDQITIEGRGQPGWETELYRNNELLDFGTVDDTGQYRFENVQLMVGNNLIRVVFYGPQGQVQEESQNYLISGGMVRPGEFAYDFGAVDAGKDMLPLTDNRRAAPEGLGASGYAAYGLSTGLTLFGGAARVPVAQNNGGSRDYVSGGAMFTALGGLAQVEAYKQIDGGTALDTRFVGAFKGIRVNAQHAIYRSFESIKAGFGAAARKSETDIALNTTVRTGFGALGLQLNGNHQRLENGTALTTIGTRQSIGQGGLRLSHQTSTSLRDGDHISSAGSLSATTRYHRVNLRGTVNYDMYPVFDLTSAQAEARFTQREGLTAGVNASYDFVNNLVGLGGNIGYDFGKVLAGLDVGWLEDRGVQVLLRASTSFGPYGRNGGYMMSSQKLTAARPVRAHVFLDNDMDGVFGEGDEALEDVRVQVGLRSSDDATDADGRVVALQSGGSGGISSVQVDKTSLFDPYYVPAVEGYNTVPRVGSIVDISLPVVQTGSIDGTVLRADNGRGVSGMRLELVAPDGTVAMATETAYDGFYTFDYVRMGTYVVRADPSYGVDVPPATVAVTADELFVYGIDLELRVAMAEDAAAAAEEEESEEEESEDEAAKD